MHSIVKWPNIIEKSCSVNTAKFLKYVWPFYNIMHERVKNYTIDGYEKALGEVRFPNYENFDDVMRCCLF